MIGNSLNFDHQPKGKVALNDLGDVGAIVQKFVADVLKDYDSFGKGVATRDDAMAAIRLKATVLGDAFMGKDPTFYATEWNTPDRLGAHVRAQRSVKFEEPSQDPGQAFFLFLATQVVKSANDLHGGDEDPEWVGFMLQRAVKSAIKFLLTGEG